MKNNVHPIFQNIFANVLGELPPKASCFCTDESYCQQHAEEAAMQRRRHKDYDWRTQNGLEYIEYQALKAGAR